VEEKELGKKIWEQTISVETEIEEKEEYLCPDCKEFLFSVPCSQPVPKERTTITCSKGHKVRVPKFPQFR